MSRRKKRKSGVRIAANGCAGSFRLGSAPLKVKGPKKARKPKGPNIEKTTRHKKKNCYQKAWKAFLKEYAQPGTGILPSGTANLTVWRAYLEGYIANHPECK